MPPAASPASSASAIRSTRRGGPSSSAPPISRRWRRPTLICQGTRDTFGTREEVAGYALSPAIEIAWVEDGDHDLRPRKSVTGVSAAAQRQALAERVRDWAGAL